MPLHAYVSYLRTRSNTLTLSPVMLSVLTLAFIFCTQNASFFALCAEIFAGHGLSLAAFVAAVFCLMLAYFSVFSFPWVLKPFLIVMVVLGSVTSFYMDTLGVMIDRDMIQNVMVTTFTESKHLLTLSLVIHVAVFGLLPALLILVVPVRHQSLLWTALTPVLTFTISLALAAGLLLSDMKSYASILRERKDLMGSFQPGAPLVGAIRYAEMINRATNITVSAIGQDAQKGAAYAPGAKPVLTIVVAGETARAQNFSLNGYGVPTNPQLAKLPIVNFTNVHSCGTATAVSLPCMFSKYTRDSYSYEKGLSTENLLDVLTHADFNVAWWDNNTGDKNVADRVAYRAMYDPDNADHCGMGECTDGIFVDALRAYAKTITQDTVLVLHQIGSHGPTYYLRYPEAFERFSPACRTAEFKDCTPEEITNAYDNTIAFTDDMLAQTIAVLNAQDGLATALVYVSDHGESLGEAGLYLHGSPYFMAPETQTHVPMLLWMSERFKTRFSVDQNCLTDKADSALSHDNLFHSVLGMLDIDTKERDPALDIFATCRTTQTIASR